MRELEAFCPADIQGEPWRILCYLRISQALPRCWVNSPENYHSESSICGLQKPLPLTEFPLVPPQEGSVHEIPHPYSLHYIVRSPSERFLFVSSAEQVCFFAPRKWGFSCTGFLCLGSVVWAQWWSLLLTWILDINVSLFCSFSFGACISSHTRKFTSNGLSQ